MVCEGHVRVCVKEFSSVCRCEWICALCEGCVLVCVGGKMSTHTHTHTHLSTSLPVVLHRWYANGTVLPTKVAVDVLLCLEHLPPHIHTLRQWGIHLRGRKREGIERGEKD